VEVRQFLIVGGMEEGKENETELGKGGCGGSSGWTNGMSDPVRVGFINNRK